MGKPTSLTQDGICQKLPISVKHGDRLPIAMRRLNLGQQKCPSAGWGRRRGQLLTVLSLCAISPKGARYLAPFSPDARDGTAGMTAPHVHGFDSNLYSDHFDSHGVDP
jgi:hypothetical protein